ncbi:MULTISPECIES: glycosyltransferase family 8 protein [unclassified Pseudocitrobacter]|uniref:glycosyltransferase family 8 protein n=1 Tax=unclassified Pseudocitrobacter TaxID=2638778 RepID=UPI0023E436FA|nr:MULTISPECIES: glycosyltransferase [unclassified Pseudocitrobacter]MDF3826811.1 glycosyltransferase [Pseudocitrobacter sp. 2023EL-00150]MEC5372546.1 glycosyltransferase family 8 protein [Pseudocitrobacter sp. MW920760]
MMNQEINTAAYRNNFVSHQEALFSNDSEMDKTLHIALCFDHNFAMPAGVAIFSIIENNKNTNLHFHLITTGITDADVDSFKKLKVSNVSITVYYIDDNFNINSDTLVLGIPLSTCLRFLIPEVIDKEIESILYLDCDVICHGDISGLMHVDFGNAIAAVISDSQEMKDRVEQLGYNVNFHCYFNAGVMLINTEAWRGSDITGQALTMINSGKVFRYADQDVLNILLNDKLLYLDAKYNNKVTLSVNEDVEQKNIDGTLIMHYVTPSKPWYKIFQAKRFDSYFNNSPWSLCKRYLSPSYSVIRLKAKHEVSQGNYFEGLKYYILYIVSKLSKRKL